MIFYLKKHLRQSILLRSGYTSNTVPPITKTSMPPLQPPTASSADHQQEGASMRNDGQSPRAQSPMLTPTKTNSIKNNISNVDWVTEADMYAEEVYTFDDDDKLDKFSFTWID